MKKPMTNERIEALERVAEAAITHYADLDNPSMYNEFRLAVDALKALDAPKHAFPESDDDLKEEMFESNKLQWLVRYRCDYGDFMCTSDDGDEAVWSVIEIRARAPLGPSPRKQIEQARKRVVYTSYECLNNSELNKYDRIDDLLAAHENLKILEEKYDNG